jgi:hypothetical protein
MRRGAAVVWQFGQKLGSLKATKKDKPPARRKLSSASAAAYPLIGVFTASLLLRKFPFDIGIALHAGSRAVLV